MSSLSNFLSENNIDVIRYEKTVFPDGSIQENPVFYIPTSLLNFNPKNNRFRPKTALRNEEQSKLIRTQNPTIFNNLVTSQKNQPCYEAIKIHFKNGTVTTMDGNRRQEATKDSGRADLLAIGYEDLTVEQFDYVTEWSEENTTKLPHDAFYKARGLALPIIEAESDLERDKIIARLKRRNIKQAQIDKAISTCLYITDFAKKMGEPEEKRVEQYKAFETVAQTRNEKFEGLRRLGEYEKVEKLDLLAIDFLKANIAHDDIKVALDGLAERSLEDPLWSDIASKTIDSSKVSDLRSIVNVIRANDNALDILGESRSFCQRLYGKLISDPDPEIVRGVKEEFTILLEKIKLLEDVSGGQS